MQLHPYIIKYIIPLLAFIQDSPAVLLADSLQQFTDSAKIYHLIPSSLPHILASSRIRNSCTTMHHDSCQHTICIN